jgi:DNA-directed RNA polymerase subunit L
VPSERNIRIEVQDDDHSLVELLTHVALSAARAGVSFAEPICRVTYQHSSVTSEVTLTLRIDEFRIDAASRVVG